MEDTIRPGDRVRGALWRGESLTDGSIYVIHSKMGVIVRRIRLAGENVVLEAENPEVKDLPIDAETWIHRFRPVARILEVVRSL